MNGMTVWQPKTGEQVTDIVVSALAERRKLCVSGHETKGGLGHPVDAKESLSLKNLSGIVDYQPEELVLVVKAGTPLDEICLLYTSPSPRDGLLSRMPSSA